MIEPQVEQGGASSWFWIAANLELATAGFGDGLACGRCGLAARWP